MLPTPDLSHLTKQDYEHVYEPAEDTFILLDALEHDANDLKEIAPKICVEIGSGSGCVSTFASKLLGPSSCCKKVFVCTDINAHASRCTVKTGHQNNVTLDAINTSLLLGLTQRLRRSVDLLLFNPPYVPTIEEEVLEAQVSKDIAGAWAGGRDGMELTWPVLWALDDLLSERGCLYLIAVKQNNVPDIMRRMKDEYGFDSKIVLQRRAGAEHLYVLRFSRPRIIS